LQRPFVNFRGVFDELRDFKRCFLSKFSLCVPSWRTRLNRRY